MESTEPVLLLLLLKPKLPELLSVMSPMALLPVLLPVLLPAMLLGGAPALAVELEASSSCSLTELRVTPAGKRNSLLPGGCESTGKGAPSARGIAAPAASSSA